MTDEEEEDTPLRLMKRELRKTRGEKCARIVDCPLDISPNTEIGTLNTLYLKKKMFKFLQSCRFSN